ncbi:uncharacterized protein LOC135818369 isoform X1 [Sycon ciliatum]|uniref:uncharacterized protein LOC135818369 isoform X1 n=2 Tax=Sycon ciliatum TaxID=27933 RepID=UPI0031F6F77A
MVILCHHGLCQAGGNRMAISVMCRGAVTLLFLLLATATGDDNDTLAVQFEGWTGFGSSNPGPVAGKVLWLIHHPSFPWPFKSGDCRVSGTPEAMFKHAANFIRPYPAAILVNGRRQYSFRHGAYVSTYFVLRPSKWTLLSLGSWDFAPPLPGTYTCGLGPYKKMFAVKSRHHSNTAFSSSIYIKPKLLASGSYYPGKSPLRVECFTTHAKPTRMTWFYNGFKVKSAFTTQSFITFPSGVSYTELAFYTCHARNFFGHGTVRVQQHHFHFAGQVQRLSISSNSTNIYVSFTRLYQALPTGPAFTYWYYTYHVSYWGGVCRSQYGCYCQTGNCSSSGNITLQTPRNKPVNGDERVVFTNLWPSAVYFVEVYAASSLGAGPIVKKGVVTDAAPPGPVRDATSQLVDRKTNTYTIRWLEPLGTNLPVLNYRLDCCGSWEAQIGRDISKDSREVTVELGIRYCAAEVTISAVNEKGLGAVTTIQLDIVKAIRPTRPEMQMEATMAPTTSIPSTISVGASCSGEQESVYRRQVAVLFSMLALGSALMVLAVLCLDRWLGKHYPTRYTVN